MLYIIADIVMGLLLLGLITSYTIGGFIHILPEGDWYKQLPTEFVKDIEVCKMNLVKQYLSRGYIFEQS